MFSDLGLMMICGTICYVGYRLFEFLENRKLHIESLQAMEKTKEIVSLLPENQRAAHLAQIFNPEEE